MAELLRELDNLELTKDELALLTVDDGASATDSVELEIAEAAMSTRDRVRSRSISTGHRIKILEELKQGKLSFEQICLNHRLTKTQLVLIAADDALQELTNQSHINLTKKHMSNRFYQLADLSLSHITVQKLERLDANKLAIIAAISLDKARLIEGQSTANLSFRGLVYNIHEQMTHLSERKKALMEQLAAKRGVAIVGSVV